MLKKQKIFLKKITKTFVNRNRLYNFAGLFGKNPAWRDLTACNHGKKC